MKKVASLKICVLGGRSFGKTSLLSSLIAISGTKEAGISTLGDNQRKLAIYNDYKDGHGKLSATSWDDICQFRYKITGGGNKRWVVSFIDYPGEFFQKFFEDEYSGILNGVLAKMKISGQSGKPTQEDMSYGGETKKAKRIFKEILSADALIVLLPADSEKPEYKKLLSTFKARLESLLQTIEERNPYIPVCLAINKSDMLENKPVEDLLRKPEFAGFHNMLTRERGRCYFYQPVSAFGGNKATGLSPDTENIEDLRQTWDGKSEPQNVLPMLIKVSEMAEEGRYKLLRERFDKATTAAKTLIWPFSWFHVRGLGANKEEDRKYCVKNLVRCAVRFGAFILISAFAAFCAMSTTCSLNAWSTIRDYDKKLSSAEQSCKGDARFILGKDDIKALSENRPRQLGRLVFFCKKKVDSLKKRYEDLEDDRNWRVFTTVREECQGKKICDGGDAMDVTERLKRFDDRIIRYQNAAKDIFGWETRIAADERLKKRGTDSLLVGEKLNQIIATEVKGKGSLERDKSFYQDLAKVYSSPDKDFCKKAEGFLQQYQSVKEHLKSKCDKVKTDLESHEKALTDDADSYLQQHADVPDSENYKDRISRAELRINKVQELFDQSSTKLPSKKLYDDVRINAEELVRNLKADAPCYEALKKLREDNATIATGKVRRIYAFLDQYKQYDRCEKFMAPFRCEYSNELSRIQSQCLNNVTNNYVKDSQYTAEKIKRIQNQIAAYQCAYNEYVIGGDEFRDAEKSISQLKGMLDAAKKMNGCEMQLHRIEASSYNGRLRALDNFKNEYKEILTAEQNTTVTNLEEEALKYWQNYQSTNEWRYAIKEDDPLDVQKLNAGKLETVYSTLMGEVLPNSSYYTLLGQKKLELGDRKQSVERDQKLENAFRALPSTNAVERCQLLNAIDVFESKYHDADYTSKHAKQVFDQLKRRKDEAERAFWSDYTNQIDKVQCPPETNFLARCQWADACRKISEESYNGLGSNNVIRLSLEAKHRGYGEQYRRFAKFSDLTSRVNEIANKSPTNDVRVACDRLSEIKKFYSTYPLEANQDPLVWGYYSQLKGVQEQNEGVVSQYLEEQLKDMDDELPYGAAENKKLSVWKKEIDLLGEYIAKLIEGTSLHTVYKQRLEDLNSRFSVVQRKDMFDKDYAKLKGEIDNELDLERKSQKIREFLGKNGDVRSNDFARDKIASLEMEADRIEGKIKFNEYNGRLDKVVEDRPAEDGDFTQFKAQISSLQEELNRFSQNSYLKKQYLHAGQKLKDQLEYVKKAEGDGGWKAIEKREEEYKNNPCEATEKKLRTALDIFDEKRFETFLERKKKTDDNFKRDIELRNKVSSSKVSFFDKPSHSAFVEFKNAVTACSEWEKSYGCKWPFVEKCLNYISKIEPGPQVKLTVESVTFANSWKSVTIRVADRPDYQLFRDFDRHSFGDIKVPLSGLRFNVQYKNFASYRGVSETMSLWDILKGGASSGDWNTILEFEVIEDILNPKKYTGTLQLSIQGIPCMP